MLHRIGFSLTAFERTAMWINICVCSMAASIIAYANNLPNISYSFECFYFMGCIGMAVNMLLLMIIFVDDYKLRKELEVTK